MARSVRSGSRLSLPAFEARQVQELTDQARELGGLTVDRLKRPRGPLRLQVAVAGEPPQRELRLSREHRDGCPQLVRGRRQELVPGSQGGFGRFARAAFGLQRHPQPLFGALSFGNFRLQGLCLLLQNGYRAKSVVLIDEGRKTLGGDDARVLLAHVAKQLGECLTAKAIHRVAAEQRERQPVLQVVPQLLEANRGAMVAAAASRATISPYIRTRRSPRPRRSCANHAPELVESGASTMKRASVSAASRVT